MTDDFFAAVHFSKAGPSEVAALLFHEIMSLLL